jgi:uncharacterized protein (TIGR02266 family)
MLDDTATPISLTVDYDDVDDLVGEFTANLSSGSMFVATDTKLPVHTRVRLLLSCPGLVEPLFVLGTVAWTRIASAEGGAGAGIDIDTASREPLAAMVERIRLRDPKVIAQLVNVLFVEDNRHFTSLIQESLRSAARRELGGSVAFAFHTAEDGRSAVELLRRRRFDALIVDVYLPLLDGTEVIAHARGPLGLADLPIIAVSGGGETARRWALDAGADVFLDKPMRLRHMMEAIRQLLHPSGLVAAT